MIAFIVGFVGFFISAIFLALGVWQVAVAIGIALIASLIIPFEGWGYKRDVKTIQLINLKRDIQKDCYIEVRGKKVFYAYDDRKSYGLDDVIYEERYVRSNVKICESNKCKLPIMKKYVTKPNRYMWAVALIPNKVEYVFYIPERTVFNVKNNKSKEKGTTETVV